MSLRTKIIWHISTILFFILFESYIIFLTGSKANFWDYFTFYWFDILYFYCSTLLVLPTIDKFKPQRFKKYILIVLWITITATLNLLISKLLYLLHGQRINAQKMTFILIKSVFRQTYLFGFALGLWYARKSINQEKQKRLLDVAVAKQNEEKAKLELALLRTQMSPHLMVNALSSVQGILMERAPETVRIIYSLMDIQTSALEMSNPAFRNSLSNELKVMQQVIDLFKNLGKTNFQLSLEVDEESKQMDFPPHALVTLIENVFKHADFNKKDMPPFILIKADISKVQILIQNKTAINLPNSEREQMGTKSVLQTLENFYPKRYRWKESFAAGFYELDLKILRNDPA